MRCEEFWERFGEEVATGRQLPQEAAEHLRHCDTCASEVGVLRKGIEDLRSMLHEDVPDNLWDSIRKGVHSGIKLGPSKSILKHWWRLAFVPMTVVVLLFIMLWPLSQQPSLTMDDLEVMFVEPLADELFEEDYLAFLNNEVYEEYYKEVYIYDFPEEWELIYY